MLRTCVTCKKVTGSSYLLPSPAELPKFRLDTVSPPFSNIGVDFTGHFLVKDQRGNICLFTCLTTYAISLELVEDLSTSSFLQAFRRHCSVYSTPRFMLSDNAQIFKCAEKDLQTLLALFDKDTVQQAFAYKRIEFRYIPARSPHWGGVYKRLIGLTKTCLKEVLDRSLASFFQLNTLLKEIQAVLNDHPLTYITSDNQDIQPLMPSQLLFGFSLSSLPYAPHNEARLSDPTFGDRNDINRIYTRRAELYRHFTTRFYKEYLFFLGEIHSLHVKKHQSTHNSIKIGDVVLVADTDKPRHHWELGLIQDLILGTDKLRWAVVVRTPRGLTARSIIKLCPLEVGSCSSLVMEDMQKSSTEQLTLLQRPIRRPAFMARDAITAQLIDNSQD